MTTHKLLDYIGWTFLAATIALLRFSERLLDNIIQVKSFLIEYSIYGTILSGIVLFIIYKMSPSYYTGGEKRASAVLSYFLGVIAAFVFCCAYYNLEIAKRNTKYVKAIVANKSLNARYKTPYLKLKIDGREERFQPDRGEWNRIAENDTIVLTVGRGQLGYDYILAFN